MRLPRAAPFWYGLFAIWFAVLWWLSSRVNSFPPALEFRFSDKLLHFGWFFGGAGLLAAALDRSLPSATAGTRFLTGISVVTLVGLIDEIHQYHVPGRTADVSDLVADFLGAAAGSLTFLGLRSAIFPPTN